MKTLDKVAVAVGIVVMFAGALVDNPIAFVLGGLILVGVGVVRSRSRRTTPADTKEGKAVTQAG